MNRVSIALGTANFGESDAFWGQSDAYVLEALDVLKKYGCNKLDSAQAYNGSEARIGKLQAGSARGFQIDTKWLGGWSREKDANTPGALVETAKASLERLKTDQIDIFYLHAPIYDTPLEEYLAGVNAAHQAGIFRRFGLSNYPVEEVQKVYDICRARGFVLPTVYQGNYSAFARLPEETLFPLLRKLGIAFYAYSPIAGGFLTKSRADIESGKTRFSPDQMYGLYYKMFVKDIYLEALEEWEQLANDEGISKAELAYRWIVFNSGLAHKHGDGVVVGASRITQLEQTLSFCTKGPLGDTAVKKIDALWHKVKHEAPIDNYQTVRSA